VWAIGAPRTLWGGGALQAEAEHAGADTNSNNVVNGVLTATLVMTVWKIKTSRNANLVVNN